MLAIGAAFGVAFLLPSMAASYLCLAAIAAVHGAWLLPKVYRARQAPSRARRVDGPMVASLGFILWFVLVPLFGAVV